MENLKSDNYAARIRSLTGHGAGAWLETIPTTDKHALKPNEFRLASHLRLGNSLPFNQWLKTCDLDKHGYHLLTCKYGGGPVWTNDLHIHHQKEPRHRYADTENRPDIVFYDIATGSTKELDIALTHPWSKDTIKGATKEGGYAAAKREVKKIIKYNSELLHDGSKPHMIPLVFEHWPLRLRGREIPSLHSKIVKE